MSYLDPTDPVPQNMGHDPIKNRYDCTQDFRGTNGSTPGIFETPGTLRPRY